MAREVDGPSGRGRARFEAGSANARPPHKASAKGEAGGGPGAAEEARMSLAELTEAAGVSVRTVRYYIAEGLLPPPEGAGPGSAYAPAHLDRLRLIQRLKEDYLPLREIRRRLAGLSDDEVRTILAKHEAPLTSEYDLPYDPELAGARDYLALLETRERYRTEPLGLTIPTAPAPSVAPPAASAAPPPSASAVTSELASLRQQPRPAENVRLPPQAPDELWRRIGLGEGAELVIAERVYARHRDRIDWLVRWARKVFA